MAKYTMKIFDNDTGKLIRSLDFNVIIAGISGMTLPEDKKPKDGMAVSTSMCLCAGTLAEIGCALNGVDKAQEDIMAQDPKIGISYMISKKNFSSCEEVDENGST